MLLTENPRVGGSIPPLATISHGVEARKYSAIAGGLSARAATMLMVIAYDDEAAGHAIYK